MLQLRSSNSTLIWSRQILLIRQESLRRMALLLTLSRQLMTLLRLTSLPWTHEPPPPQNITLDDYAESKGLQGSSIAMAAVTVHNVLRRQHGAPLLQWSDECAEYAQKQADECQCNGGLSHGSTEAPSGSHGQNLAWSSAGIGAGWSVEKAVRSWYGEIEEYDWSQPGFQSGTGHFTQVIWKSTTHVGVGVSTDGKNIAANYYPAGNVQGRFPENVEPLLQGM